MPNYRCPRSGEVAVAPSFAHRNETHVEQIRTHSIMVLFPRSLGKCPALCTPDDDGAVRVVAEITVATASFSNRSESSWSLTVAADRARSRSDPGFPVYLIRAGPVLKGAVGARPKRGFHSKRKPTGWKLIDVNEGFVFNSL